MRFEARRYRALARRMYRHAKAQARAQVRYLAQAGLADQNGRFSVGTRWWTLANGCAEQVGRLRQEARDYAQLARSFDRMASA